MAKIILPAIDRLLPKTKSTHTHRALPKKETHLRHDDESLDGLFQLDDGRHHGRQEPVELHHLLLQHDRQRRKQPVLLNSEEKRGKGKWSTVHTYVRTHVQ